MNSIDSFHSFLFSLIIVFAVAFLSSRDLAEACVANGRGSGDGRSDRKAAWAGQQPAAYTHRRTEGVHRQSIMGRPVVVAFPRLVCACSTGALQQARRRRAAAAASQHRHRTPSKGGARYTIIDRPFFLLPPLALFMRCSRLQCTDATGSSVLQACCALVCEADGRDWTGLDWPEPRTERGTDEKRSCSTHACTCAVPFYA
jgi:hypothetical protein